MFEIQVKRKFGDKKIICKTIFFLFPPEIKLFIYLFIYSTNTCRKCKTTLTADVHEAFTSYPGNNVSKYKKNVSVCLLMCQLNRFLQNQTDD